MNPALLLAAAACGAIVGPPRFTRRSFGAAAAALGVCPPPFASRPLWGRPTLAAAAPPELLPASAPSVRPGLIPALCDPAVSVFRLPQTGQTVVLVGTAHISEDSATLVRQVIRSSRPQAVMVELDFGRASALVQRIGAAAVGPAGEQLAIPGGGITKPAAAAGERHSVGGVARRLARGDTEGAGAEAVGLAISQLYKNLDALGFRSGGEFVAAMEEAKSLGATVVLGDQDASITLSRLRDAFKQLADDGTLRRILDEANAPPIPPGEAPPGGTPAPGLRRLVARTEGALGSAGFGAPMGKGSVDGAAGGEGGVGTPGSVGAGGSGGGVLDSRESVQAALSVMQERGNVRALVDFMREEVPPVHQALIAERDAILARSLRAALADTVGGPRATVVGVVGLAHMDGIEAALTRGGNAFDAGSRLRVPPLAGVVAAKPVECARSLLRP